MIVPTDFSTDQRDKAIVQILTDAVIFERIFTGMQETVKAANPDCEDWDPTFFYNGYANAWIFLDAYEFPDNVQANLHEELGEVFDKHVSADRAKPFKDRERAENLAKRIFADWEFCIDRTEHKLKSK